MKYLFSELLKYWQTRILIARCQVLFYSVASKYCIPFTHLLDMADYAPIFETFQLVSRTPNLLSQSESWFLLTSPTYKTWTAPEQSHAPPLPQPHSSHGDLSPSHVSIGLTPQFTFPALTSHLNSRFRARTRPHKLRSKTNDFLPAPSSPSPSQSSPPVNGASILTVASGKSSKTTLIHFLLSHPTHI